MGPLIVSIRSEKHGRPADWCLLFLIILLFYWGIRGIFRQRAFSQCRRRLQACISTVFTWGCCGGFTKWSNFRFTYYFIVFYIWSWRADSRIGKRRRILIPRKPVSRFVLILYIILTWVPSATPADCDSVLCYILRMYL